MSSYAPPAGPPPPSVPPGWVAVFNDQYKEWFYVNLTTKESTWTKPTEPAPGYGGGDDHAPSGAPPAYSTAGPEKPTAAGDIKTGLHDTKAPTGDSDEALARRLQEEENARASSSTAPGQAAQVGQAADYYNNSGSSGPSAPGVGNQADQQRFGGRPEEGYNPSTSRDKGKGGLFGKLMGKMQSQGGSYPPRQDHGGYQNQNYGQYPPQQQHYGNSPMAPGYGPPQQGYGYPPQQQGYYGGGYAQQQPARKHGMGAGGAAALGVGGGLLGGMLIGEALGDAGDHGDYGGGDGGDYGGDGGGDFGGDGGGDFGGGDFGGGGF